MLKRIVSSKDSENKDNRAIKAWKEMVLSGKMPTLQDNDTKDMNTSDVPDPKLYKAFAHMYG